MGYSALATVAHGDANTPARANQTKDNFEFLAHPPACRVNRSTDQTGIVTGTDTVVLFPNENYDTDTIHSTSSNTGRLTATTAGKYRIKGAVAFTNTATGVRSLYLRLNNATRIDADTDDASAGPHFVFLHVDTDYQLAAGDFVELVVWHNSGVNEILKAADGVPHFEMQLFSL